MQYVRCCSDWRQATADLEPVGLGAQEPGEGLFTENCLVLVEGEYTAEETIKVLAMGHPPSEKRDAAR